MKTSVMCIVRNETSAHAIVEKLKLAHFSNNDISVLFPNMQGSRDFAHEHSTKAPEGAVAGVGAGGLLGGALGLMAGVGALAIPGVGPFIAAGPLLAALSGAAAGAAVGGVAGALVGMGIPEIEAKRYEGKIKGGNILISVHAESSEQVARVEEVYKALGADDICSTAEASVDGTSPDGRTRQPSYVDV